MKLQSQVIIRSKKLGVLIRDCRMLRRRTIPECANSIGIPVGTLRAWEEGLKSPSLPELETLAYILGLPLRQFWSKEAHSSDSARLTEADIAANMRERQRLIGSQLQQAREDAGISLHNLSAQSGLSTSKLKAYELGERSIPLPELEGLMALLGKPIESLFDQTGPVGQWMAEQKDIDGFLKLPHRLQVFVSNPGNQPYLELAEKLSDLSSDKLRSVAEGILEITL